MVDVSKYQMLDEIPMMLLRPDTFVGSIETKSVKSYIFSDNGVKPVWRDINYNPALLKLFDEVLQNCYDQSKRPEGKNLTRVDVAINQMSGIISIGDNSGIPVVIHPDHDMYVPCMIFGNLRSSSNYDDSEQREGGGRNGLGSKLTNIFSTYFKVETSDGKNKYERTYEDNMLKSTTAKVSSTNAATRGTKITFQPDYTRLKCSLDADNYGMMITRVYEIAACAPAIDVYLNGKKIDVKGFQKFVEKFGDEALYTENSHWRIGVLPSQDGFKHISFANATHTWLGGTHVEYLAEQLVEGVREYIKKKTKQDIKPAELKNHFFLMVDCTVYNPRFSSQTKEHMNLAIKDYGTTFRFDDKFFAKLIKSTIVQDIIEWAINRKKIQDAIDLKKLGKDVKKNAHKTIDKYESASQKTDRHECMLFVCEGDSAANPLISARDPKKQGVFALGGKPLNLTEAKVEQIKKNVEIQSLMTIMNLTFGDDADIDNLRYGYIVIATDADQDGQHIKGLMLHNIRHKWPSLLTEGRVFFLKTPIVRVLVGKVQHEFFNMAEYEAWLPTQAGKKMEITFLKGLGGNSTADFKKYMSDSKYMVPFSFDDSEGSEDIAMLDIAFGEADDKKVWLNCE